MSLFQMSIAGGLFILFIVMVRGLALHRLPKAAFLALWNMAALRLLLPFSLPLPWDIFAFIPWAQTGNSIGTSALSSGTLPAGAAQTDMAAHSVFQAVWFAGAVLMAVYFGLIYIRGMRRFRESIPHETPAVKQWLAEQKLRRPLEVRQSDKISSPLTYGIFRPVILLPKKMDRGNPSALNFILTHELIHIRRFDGAAKLIFAAALCIHWVNPLVWVMFLLANRDLELSCDQRVIDILGGKEKTSYALTLIHMEERRIQPFSLYSHFSKLAIEERIEAIMKYKKASVFVTSLAVVLLLCTAAVFSASASSGDGQEPTESSKMTESALYICQDHEGALNLIPAGEPVESEENGKKTLTWEISDGGVQDIIVKARDDNELNSRIFYVLPEGELALTSEAINVLDVTRVESDGTYTLTIDGDEEEQALESSSNEESSQAE